MVDDARAPASAVTTDRAGRTGILARLVLLVFIGGAVWYGLARIDWPALGRALAAANPLWILAGIAGAIASHLLRAHRWRMLIPDGRSIRLRDAFSATMIGYMFNNIIPRSGELARPWVLARRVGRPLSAMIASVVVERIIDGLSLALVVVALTLAGRELIERLLPEYTAGGLVAAIVIPVLALVALVVLAVRTSLGERLVELVARRLPERLGVRVRTIVADFRTGASLDRSQYGPLTVPVLVALSVVIWLGYWFGLYSGFFAFGFDRAYGLGVEAALVTLGITSIGMTIAPTPGGFLVYHSFCIAVLTIAFGVPDEQAAAFALLTHGAPYIAVTAIGAGFALAENVSLGSVLRDRRNLPPPPASSTGPGPGPSVG
ncbi:MAG TPA: lysylphosphatidylglycerol synthase transmembrane domain-containing protein [Candidatus Kapabacteria bacterium]|nr:lysylphosphatidylglycerol synthase transmembrane domain-containing protein [Candidatus Kapabacteria bacterium]